MVRQSRELTIELPEEFLQLCEYDMVSPEDVLCGFVADLCGITSLRSEIRIGGHVSHGSVHRDRARVYYDRIHAYQAQWIRENVRHLARQRQELDCEPERKE